MKTIEQSRIPVQEDGRIGCTSCGAPATRTITYDLYRRSIRMKEAFCASHGSWLLHETYRRPITTALAA